jgi:hypothetical protein
MDHDVIDPKVVELNVVELETATDATCWLAVLVLATVAK